MDWRKSQFIFRRQEYFFIIISSNYLMIFFKFCTQQIFN